MTAHLHECTAYLSHLHVELDADDVQVSLLLAGGDQLLVGLGELLQLTPHRLHGLLGGRVRGCLQLGGAKGRAAEVGCISTKLVHLFIHCLWETGVGDEECG